MNNIKQKGRVYLTARKRILFLLFMVLTISALAGLSVFFLRQNDEVKTIKKDKEIKQGLIKEKHKDRTKLKLFKKKYKDMVGWIEIKGTDFSYPVMQSGTKGHRESNPEFYLNRNVKGEYSVTGTPFLDFRCDIDSDELIIYGHNMDGKSHFGYLQNYRNESFYKNHKDMSFTKVGGVEEKYDILSVLVTDIYSDCFKYTDIYNDEDYKNFFDYVIDNSIYQCGAANAIKNDMKNFSVEEFFHRYQLVTLSTCRTGEGRDARLLVIGCKLK